MEKGQKLEGKELDHQVRDQMSLTKPFKTYNYQEEQQQKKKIQWTTKPHKTKTTAVQRQSLEQLLIWGKPVALRA